MKSQRNIARYLSSSILAVSVLLSGFISSGYPRSRHFIPSLAAPHPRAVQAGGESWQPVNTGLSSLNVFALAIDPVNTATIYVSVFPDGVFKSIDGGATWSRLGLNVRNAQALAVNFLNPNIIYVGIDEGGVCNSNRPLFTSTNGGASWSNQNSMADCDISLIVIDPTSPNTLYAGSAVNFLFSGGIVLWKSTDGGASWNGRRTGNIGLASYGLTINPANSQILYAPGDLYDGVGHIIDSGLFVSTDGGTNWSATGLTNTFIRAVAIDPLNPNTLYAGSISTNGTSQLPLPFRGMLKSTDGGASWREINNGLTNISSITAIVVDRDNPSILYISTSGGVFKSTDGGANWSAFNNGLTDLNVRALTLAPGNPNTLYAGTAGGVFKITENAPAANPIDDAEFFARQHYRDFLSREPDPAGLAFWTGEIASCGADAGCLDLKRQHVSAAFFLSIEFQQTGYLVYRARKAAYGNLPGKPVPVTRDEMLQDVRTLGDGVVVNEDGWEQKIEQNKRAYFDQLAASDRFTALYSQSLTPEQFVDALNANAGGALSQAERDALVAELRSGTKTRAQALRAVAEDADLYSAEFNKAFVLMQYFGYLRRNPNEAPEPTPDFTGYHFWLAKLNQFGGDYVAAEMVKSFIVSGEYRQRFGLP